MQVFCVSQGRRLRLHPVHVHHREPAQVPRRHPALALRAGRGCTIECNDSSAASVRSLAGIIMLLQHIYCGCIGVPQLTCERFFKPFRCFKRACVVGTCININEWRCDRAAQMRPGGEGAEVQGSLERVAPYVLPLLAHASRAAEVGTDKETKQQSYLASSGPSSGREASSSRNSSPRPSPSRRTGRMAA